jgi:aromatic ring-cleaving dioxygenase
MARWAEALDAQLDAYKFYASPRGHDMAAGFARANIKDAPGLDRPGSPFRHLDERIEVALFNADPVYVDPDMMTVYEAAWPGFKPEPLMPTDLVTSAGFLLLPRPVTTHDVHDKLTSFRAIMWEPIQMRTANEAGLIDKEPRGGILLYLFHATEDLDDYSIAGDRGVAPFILSHVMPWEFGDADVTLSEHDERSIYRPIQCLWRLMMQTLAVHTPEKAGGPYGRRWEKAKMPEKKVTVVRLRRTYEDKDPGDEPGTVEWTHRWLVNGFWRQQWYPSIQQHRQIWVSPFVKGPSHLPLVIKGTHVFEFVR